MCGRPCRDERGSPQRLISNRRRAWVHPNEAKARKAIPAPSTAKPWRLGRWASYSIVQRYAHLAADHLAPWAERLGQSRGNRGTNPSQHLGSPCSSRHVDFTTIVTLLVQRRQADRCSGR